MILLRSFLLVISLVFLPFYMQAQKLHTQSKKADKFYNKALAEYTLENNIQAYLLLEKALKADDHFQEAYFLIAEIKTDLGYPQDAIAFYKTGISINPDLFPNEHYFLAKLYLNEGFYEEAKLTYQKFLSFSNISSELKKNAYFQLNNCLFALDAIKKPLAFEPINLGENINSKNSEYFPSLTIDNELFLFTRKLENANKSHQEDFFEAIRIDSIWGGNRPIDELNTPYNEGAASLSADGKTLVFTACEYYGDYGNNRKGYGSCDLFIARKTGNHWSKAHNMGSPVNTSNWESQASLSADGKHLYFIRAPKKSLGHSDIYRADLDENGYWDTPVKLSSVINTEKDEQAVFIHPDNQTLYFSSNGHIGMGGTDLYLSKWDAEKKDWGSPVNLGYPINTHKDESTILVSPDGKLAYFASNRPEGFGELDIYSFQLAENIRPEKVTYLKGVIYDAETKKPLSAQFELIDLETGNRLNYSVSDVENGDFLLTLSLGENYLLNVSKQSYLFYSDQFLLKDEYSTNEPFLKNIPLQTIAIGKNVILKNIFFETDKYTLKKASEIELKKLLSFLNENPKIHIAIHGHTDNTGSAEYNYELSNQRAKAVYYFLIEHDIDANRLIYNGLGFDKPIADNSTEEGRAQNRRTEFVITKM